MYLADQSVVFACDLRATLQFQFAFVTRFLLSTEQTNLHTVVDTVVTAVVVTCPGPFMKTSTNPRYDFREEDISVRSVIVCDVCLSYCSSWTSSRKVLEDTLLKQVLTVIYCAFIFPLLCPSNLTHTYTHRKCTVYTHTDRQSPGTTPGWGVMEQSLCSMQNTLLGVKHVHTPQTSTPSVGPPFSCPRKHSKRIIRHKTFFSPQPVCSLFYNFTNTAYKKASSNAINPVALSHISLHLTGSWSGCCESQWKQTT